MDLITLEQECQQETISRLKEILKDHVSYFLGSEIRSIIARWSDKNYIRKHSAERYLQFMRKHECDFKKNHPQGGPNHPHVYTLFSVVSQRVQGDCLEECLDKAIEYEEGKSMFKGVSYTPQEGWKLVYSKNKKENEK